jgi:hypothetical protein
MICYKDKTFCPFEDCINFDTCDRALSDEVILDAILWWGCSDAPVLRYNDKPECYIGMEVCDIKPLKEEKDI